MKTNNRLLEGVRRCRILCALLPLTLWGPAAAAGSTDDSGLEFFASGDLVGEWGFGSTAEERRRLIPREIELAMFSPIDHEFDGMISMAAHLEGGQTLFELHEARISNSKLIPRTRFRVGQFFLGVGRLNQIHRHDWPFISTPKVHEQFLAAEGAIDNGAEFTTLLPTPFFLEWTLGIGSGWTFGHSHSGGLRPKVPTFYTRPSTFIEIDNSDGIAIGNSYLYRQDNGGSEMSLVGLDVTFKKRVNRVLRWLIQSESWYRFNSEVSISREIGSYIYGQYGLNQNWSFGLRTDTYFLLGSATKTIAFVPTVTYASSEFARFRLAYEHTLDFAAGQETELTPVLQTQIVFMLGAHPAHDF